MFSYHIWLLAKILHQIHKMVFLTNYEIGKPKTLRAHFTVINRMRCMSLYPNQFSVPYTQSAY